MRKDIFMRRASNGRWESPLGDVNYGQQFGPPVPVTPDPTKIGDDFFAPGEEEKMKQQIAADQAVDAFKKKLYWLAGGMVGALILIGIFHRLGGKKK